MEIKKYESYVQDFVRRLNDVRFVGQVIFVIIVLLISWSGIKSIQTNYGLQKQITSIQHQNTLQKLQNDNLKLQNDYYNSDQYLELAARQNFGLAAPGEKLIIVPDNVIMANTINVAMAKQDTIADHQPAYQRNFQSWIDFFLHRQNSN